MKECHAVCMFFFQISYMFLDLKHVIEVNEF